MDGSTGAPLIALDTPLAELEDEITELSAHVAAATFRLLRLIAEFDRRGGWSGDGLRSCAHWLNWKCGLDMGAAREKVRVAHALDALPEIGAAFERGALSYSKVRAMTRVATPANESALLNIALHGTAHHVERVVRSYRRVLRLDDTNRQHAARFLNCYEDEDGCVAIRGRIPAEHGALIMRALEAAEETIREQTRQLGPKAPAESAPTDDTAQARRADALALLAETFLARGPAELRGGDRQQIVVHVSAETFRTGSHSDPNAAPIAREPHEPALAAEACRRIGCDCSLVHITESAAGEPLTVGRKTRSIPPAIQRALRMRDGGCRFPGCTCTRYVDGHHIHHWADGGETKLSNLVLLCRFHHRLVHEGGFALHVLDDGALRFLRPDGTGIPIAASSVHRPIGEAAALAHEHALRRLGIVASTIIPRWGGERLDEDIAIEGLLRRDRGGHGAANETPNLKR